MACVYAIVCPINKHVVYIGQTKNDLEKRITHHYKRSDNTLLFNFMKSLKDKNAFPAVLILEEKDSQWGLFSEEKKWIEHYAALGHPLLNKSVIKKEKPKVFKIITDISELNP